MAKDDYKGLIVKTIIAILMIAVIDYILFSSFNVRTVLSMFLFSLSITLILEYFTDWKPWVLIYSGLIVGTFAAVFISAMQSSGTFLALIFAPFVFLITGTPKLLIYLVVAPLADFAGEKLPV